MIALVALFCRFQECYKVINRFDQIGLIARKILQTARQMRRAKLGLGFGLDVGNRSRFGARRRIVGGLGYSGCAGRLRIGGYGFAAQCEKSVGRNLLGMVLLLAILFAHRLVRLWRQPAGTLDQTVLDLCDLVFVILIEVWPLPDAPDPLQVEVHLGTAAELARFVALGTLCWRAGWMGVLLLLFLLAAIGAHMFGLLLGRRTGHRLLGVDEVTALFGAETAVAVVAFRLALPGLHAVVELLVGDLDLRLVGQLVRAGKPVEAGIALRRLPRRVHPHALVVVGGPALVVVCQLRLRLVVVRLEAPLDDRIGQVSLHLVHQ